MLKIKKKLIVLYKYKKYIYIQINIIKKYISKKNILIWKTDIIDNIFKNKLNKKIELTILKNYILDKTR